MLKASESAQRKVARQYKMLGYDVTEHPSSDDLPDFMAGLTPDIIAQSASDNVVIEVKEHGALQGSNSLVNIADKVSQRPDWRFELVVLDDRESEILRQSESDFRHVLDVGKRLRDTELYTPGYVYLAAVLVSIAQKIARKSGVNVRNRSDRDLFHDLGFRGVIPQDIVTISLEALARRNAVARAIGGDGQVSQAEFNKLLDLCDRMQQLT